MVDSRNGWARGNLQGGNPSSDYILRTTDGGSTWQDVTPAGFIRVEGTYFNDFYGGMDALNEKTAWAISTTDFLQGKYGLSGTVWRTDDGGRSWKPGNPIVLAPPSDIFATGDGYRTLQFVDASHGWLVVFVKCGMGISCEEIYQTSDGGMNWRDLSLCWSDNCASPIFIDTTTGWMKYSIPWMPDSPVSNVGALETSPFWKIQKTNNGGTTWNYVSLPPPANLVELLKDSQYSQDNIEFTDTFRRVSPGVVGLRVDYTLRDYKQQRTLYQKLLLPLR